MAKSKQPSIAVLKALTSEEAADHLYAKNVEEKAAEYEQYEPYLWQQYIESKPDSYEEQQAATALTKINLVKISAQFASPQTSQLALNRDKWAARFTEISSEIYQPPESGVVRTVVKDQLDKLGASGYFTNKVRAFYEALDKRLEKMDLPDTPFLTLSADDRNALQAAFIEYHQDWFGNVGDEANGLYSPSDLVDLFNSLLHIRAKNDSRWKSWKAILDDDKSHVSVVANEQLISVGRLRVDASGQEVLGLVAHELGVHATRFVNGSSCDKALGEGYPGYLDIEESFGVLSEWLVIGDMPHKAYDRYIDIALAMEVVPGVKLDRHELMQLAFERELGRQEAQQITIDDKVVVDAAKSAKSHVQRIFRGGDGREGEQAVFTKDAIYYPAKLEDYIVRQMSRGYSAPELIVFLLQGKFDPTDKRHLLWLEQAGVDTLSLPESAG